MALVDLAYVVSRQAVDDLPMTGGIGCGKDKPRLQVQEHLVADGQALVRTVVRLERQPDIKSGHCRGKRVGRYRWLDEHARSETKLVEQSAESGAIGRSQPSDEGQPHVVRLEARPPNIEGRGEITILDGVSLDIGHGSGSFSFDSAEVFADQVVNVLRNRELRERLAVKGKQLVKEKYNWEAVLPRFLHTVENTAR